MRSKPSLSNRHRTQLGKRALGATVVFLLPLTLPAGGVVTTADEASLRDAMVGGGTVTFACDGTIAVSNTISINRDTVLDGSGRHISISGSNFVRVFYVSSNVSLTLSKLTIANGRSESGAGIFNAGGQLILQNCILAHNSAVGADGTYLSGNSGTNGYGGAVYNLGIVKSMNCAFISNSVVGGDGAGIPSFGPGGAGGHGNGGAIVNFGTLIVSGCLLANNHATGGRGGVGGVSGEGGAGGDGNGSAIMNFGSLSMTSCLLTSNSCIGGWGGVGGSGGYGLPWGSGEPGGPGGVGGSGNGGALCNNGSVFLANNTVALNSGVGAQGGAGGQGGPPFNQSSSSGDGGNGGNGGSGYGAIYDVNGQCYLTNCTLGLNQATEGTGGHGGPTGPWPYPYPPHLGTPGANGVSGLAGSGLSTTGAHLVNTLLASNTPANCTGTIVDAGHNLSSDASFGFTGAGSLTNTDPRLGSLANNGGPTLTIALLPGSPAIDAGSTSAAPSTDQRGFPRPAGTAADIGAFEYGSILPVMSIAQSGLSLIDILVHGNSNQWCRLLAGTNFSDWTPIGTNQMSGDGTSLFHDNRLPIAGYRFYRVVMP